jgi:hypothetical protein
VYPTHEAPPDGTEQLAQYFGLCEAFLVVYHQLVQCCEPYEAALVETVLPVRHRRILWNLQAKVGSLTLAAAVVPSILPATVVPLVPGWAVALV